MLLRAVASLAVIGLVLLGVAFAARRFPHVRFPFRGRRGLLAVLETIALPGGVALHLVEVGRTRLLIGSAPHGVALLREVEPAALVTGDAA
ncbi:MAG: flagellar biosynthetic protein FliO [Candidatus Eremiobacteraeota bacterium]|nr:flagellar biosynthetic protein FliO [Candidatus Eremiobacteraeota bacterium]